MVRMDKIDDTTWAFLIVDATIEPPAILASGRLLAKSEAECIENIANLFKVMGTSIVNKGTAPSVEIYDAPNERQVYADLSPALERVDEGK